MVSNRFWHIVSIVKERTPLSSRKALPQPNEYGSSRFPLSTLHFRISTDFSSPREPSGAHSPGVSFRLPAVRMNRRALFPVAIRSSLVPSLLAQVQKEGSLVPGDRVGVAVSGGADSVALLLSLLELREELGIVLSVVHFNHQLRGAASDGDERFVARLAKKHGLEFFHRSAQIAKEAKKKRANLEATGREARYAFFRVLAEQGKVTKVAVAHTADDQAETVLAHILRGTGLAGLGGIHPVVFPVFRPLLTIRRAALRAYLRQKKQPWREDASNRDTHGMRARIRKKLLPVLEDQFQPSVVQHLTTLADLAREDESFLHSLVEEKMAEIVQKGDERVRVALGDLLGRASSGKSGAPFSELTASPQKTPKKDPQEALRNRIVRRIGEGPKQPGAQLGARHVDSVLDLVHFGQAGQSLPLPGAVEVLRERQAVVFQARSKPRKGTRPEEACAFSYDIDLRSTQRVPVPKLRCVFRFRVIDWHHQRGETTNGETVLDRERLRSPVVLRNWRPGDRLHPLGHHHAHKLKRLLNEKHISRWAREGWPVLTSGGTLAWARGFPVAAEFAATERTHVGFVIAEEPL